MVVADGPIRSARNLGGASIGVASLQDAFVLGLDAWLLDNHIHDRAGLHFVESPQSALLAMLQEKRVDAILLSEPKPRLHAFATQTVRSIARPLRFDREALPHQRVVHDDELGCRASRRRAAVRRGRMAQSSLYADAIFTGTTCFPLVSEFTEGPGLSELRAFVPDAFGSTLSATNVQPMIDVAARFKVIDRSVPGCGNHRVTMIDLGIFLPVTNNGWIISRNSPQFLPTFALNRAISRRLPGNGSGLRTRCSRWRSGAASAVRSISGSTRSNP